MSGQSYLTQAKTLLAAKGIHSIPPRDSVLWGEIEVECKLNWLHVFVLQESVENNYPGLFF